MVEYLVAFFIILAFIVINGNVKKHRQLPGPFPLPLIGGAYAFFGYLSAERILYKWTDLLKKYDGTFSVLLGNEEHILISKPEHVQVYCTSPHLLDHARLYDNFKPALGDGLFVANGASWKAKRRAWAPSFHPSVIRTFVKTFQDLADIFVERLEKEANGPEFPFSPYARDYFIDTVILSQAEFNHNSQREFRKLNNIIVSLGDILHGRAFNIFFRNETVFKLSPSGKRVEKIMNYVREYTSILIKTKKMEFAKEGVLADDDLRKNLFLRQLLNVRKASEEELHDELITIGVTGYETVSRTLGFLLLMLGKHQDVQNRVLLEDQEIQRELNGRELEMDDLQKYEYLDRVIKETLRVFPVGPLLGRSAAQDMKIGDIQVRKGTAVICHILALHRNPEIYPNPLEFNPDNFLPERIAERHPYSYIPFSSGPRGCIGTKFAMTVLKVVVPTLLRSYRVFSNRAVEDINLKLQVTMTDCAGFSLRIEKR